MFKFGRQAKLEQEIKELQTWVIGQSFVFASNIGEAFEDKNARGRYYRVSASDPQLPSLTNINQPILLMESAAFFLHGVSRFSYRPGDESVRQALYDPIVPRLAVFLLEILQKSGSDPSITERDVLDYIAARDIEYGQAPTLLGNSSEDRECALWIAANAIAAVADHEKDYIFFMESKTTLMRALVAMDMARRVERIGKLVQS